MNLKNENHVFFSLNLFFVKISTVFTNNIISIEIVKVLW